MTPTDGVNTCHWSGCEDRRATHGWAGGGGAKVSE